MIKAGTKIVFDLTAGNGMDNVHACILMRDFTEEELQDLAWERAVASAETFGLYPYAWMEEDEVVEDSDDYTDDIGGSWELYDSDKHDGRAVWGNQTEVEFEKLF